jgi:hypothetical protein
MFFFQFFFFACIFFFFYQLFTNNSLEFTLYKFYTFRKNNILAGWPQREKKSLSQYHRILPFTIARAAVDDDYLFVAYFLNGNAAYGYPKWGAMP